MPRSKDIGWLIGLKKKKTDPSICCLQESHFRAKDIHRPKVRGWKKIFCANENDKKMG